MKVSLICTVKNEEEGIAKFVESLSKQTRKPEEFIIVDGGSEDKTYEILKKLSKKYTWVVALQENGANISRGRNLAISKSKNEIIVSCDAGGVYKQDWLEKLTKGFNGEVGFGIDKPLIKNNFQKTLAKRILHKNVPGSSRNMIFSKKIWKEVGGYPEDMERAEDTLFDERIKERNYKIGRINDAICFWEMRKDLEGVRKQFYAYGYWDGVLQRKHHMLPTKYKLFIPLLILLVPFYPFLWIISKFSLSFKIDFTRRFAYLRGFLGGLLNRKPLHSR
jgi:glycosyltransferase involved in cell wall biosynthesis